PGGNHLYPLSCSWLFLLLGAGFCDCLATKGGRRTPGPRMGSPAGAKLFRPLEILVGANTQMPEDCVRDPHSPLDFGYFGPGPFNRKNHIVAVFEFLDRVGEAPPAHSVYLGYAGALVGCNFAELIYQSLDVGFFDAGRNDEQYFIHSHLTNFLLMDDINHLLSLLPGLYYSAKSGLAAGRDDV